MDASLGALDTDTRLRTGLKMTAQAFPDIASQTTKAVAHRWLDDPWAQGAFAAFAPGQMTALLPVIARPEGRVHFAGEHTSDFTGWMEGAFRSGERAAQEILMG